MLLFCSRRNQSAQSGNRQTAWGSPTDGKHEPMSKMKRTQTGLTMPDQAFPIPVSSTFVDALGALSTQKLTSHKQDVSRVMLKKQLITWLCVVRGQRQSPSTLPCVACGVIEEFVGDAWQCLTSDARAIKMETASAKLRLRTEMDDLIGSYAHKFVIEHVQPIANTGAEQLATTPISVEIQAAINSFSGTVRQKLPAYQLIERKFTALGYQVAVTYNGSYYISLSWQ